MRSLIMRLKYCCTRLRMKTFKSRGFFYGITEALLQSKDQTLDDCVVALKKASEKGLDDDVKDCLREILTRYQAKVKENQSAEYQSVELRDESEFFSNIHYDSVTDALEIFKYDELVAEPGSKFRYTTYGFTLLSAALEKAVRSSYSAQVTKFFEKLGMNHSYLDFNLPLIANRASYYYRDLNHKLNNVPEVDNSNKWAGGGLLSTAKDLLIFANAMLYSYYISEHSLADVVEKKPLLDPETIKTFWESKISDQKGHVYTLGWFRIDGTDENYGGLEDTWLRKGIYMHTGAGVGASSVLLIKPNQGCSNNTGTCVVILTNLHECSELVRLALEIAEIFESTTLGAVS